MAHGVFHWATKAKAYEKRVTKGARLQSTDGWSSEAVKAAFFRDRKPLHDHKATAAVNDAKTLFPSKIKELGKCLKKWRCQHTHTHIGSAACHTVAHRLSQQPAKLGLFTIVRFASSCQPTLSTPRHVTA